MATFKGNGFADKYANVTIRKPRKDVRNDDILGHNTATCLNRVLDGRYETERLFNSPFDGKNILLPTLKHDICNKVSFQQGYVEGETHSHKPHVCSYRPSLVNVFPKSSRRIGFFDYLDNLSSPNRKNEQENDEEQTLHFNKSNEYLVNVNLFPTTNQIGFYDNEKTATPVNASSINQLSQSRVNNDEDSIYSSTFGNTSENVCSVNAGSNVSLTQSDDSYECNSDDWWNRVSDESFLEAERLCQSPPAGGKRFLNNTTSLFDIEEPTFFNEASTFRNRSSSLIQQIFATEQSIKSSLANVNLSPVSCDFAKTMNAVDISMISQYNNDENLIYSLNSGTTENAYSEKYSHIQSDDSFEYISNDWWNRVSDESFLETERLCQSPLDGDERSMLIERNDATQLVDIEEPSFFKKDSNFVSRLPSIDEESNLLCIKADEDINYLMLKEDLEHISAPVGQSSTSITRSYRPSLVNVFPPIHRVGFYDYDETGTT